MIRMRAKNPDGRQFLILGVDRENIRRLTAGKPIVVKGDTVELDHDVIIVFGETLQDVIGELSEAGMIIPPPTGAPQ